MVAIARLNQAATSQ